jgi:phosphoglycerate kinase
MTNHFDKKTIRDIDTLGKIVLVRADYNVPLKNGKITDDYRITRSVPTIKYLMDQNCKVVICSHLGRPTGPEDQALSLHPVAKRLASLLESPVHFSPDCVGEDSRERIRNLEHGKVLLLENLRFHEEEEANDDSFARQLAQDIDVFVQDGFGVVHRAHASTDAITKHLLSVSGLLLEAEVTAINGVMLHPERPLMALVGGAKISDKIALLNRLIDIADVVAVGGAMSNTFLLAQGVGVGDSLVEADDIALARDIIAKAKKKAKEQRFIFYVPQDGVVAKEIDTKVRTRIVDWGTQVIADIESYPKPPKPEASEVSAAEKILDIGPFSGAFIAGTMQLSNTVIWNGTMGVTEVSGLQTPSGPFSQGTELVVEAMLGQFGHQPRVVVGGGDTVGYVEGRNLVNNFYHVSTGGGASMELMSGKKLPGVEALESK